jgi:Bacterial Ig-like domain (group 3)
VGHTIEVIETAANAGGSATATSSAVGPVVPPVPIDATAPSVSGSAEQGQTLAVTQGVWTNSPTSIVDQWEQCDPIGAGCTPLPGQVGDTYTLGPGDVGHTVAVLETASNAGGQGLSASSGRTPVVMAPSATSMVVVSTDTPATDQTVTLVATVSSSSSSADPSGSLTFFNGTSTVEGCLGKPVRGGQTATVVCQTSFPAGTAMLSAAYLPGPGSLVSGSTSATTALPVGRDSTSISLAVTKRVPLGTRAIYTATLVLPFSNSGPINPTGSIQFLDHGQPIARCLSEPLTKLSATCRITYRSPGAHSISARYAGDPNFGASTSSASSTRVVKGSRAGAVLGFVASTLQWTFGYHPTYSQVIYLKAFGIAPGTHVVVTCRGGGCPFEQLREATAVNGTLDLLPAFRHRRLKAGSLITVRFMHPHWIGKYYSFTMRGGHPPLVALSCLAVNRITPGVGC